MRILHVIASVAPRYGGPSQVCLELCRELARRGHEVSIFTTNVDGKGELAVTVGRPIRADGVEIRYFPIQPPRRYAFSIPLARALKAQVMSYDVAHIHSLYLFPQTVAAHYCRRYGVPYIVRPHGTLAPYHFRRHRLRKAIYEHLFEWRNLDGAAAIHFTSAQEMELAGPLGLKAPGIVVPLGIAPEDYRSANLADNFRARWPQLRGKRIILFLGRLNFKKGLDLLVKAFAEVARVQTDAHLVLAGSDNEGYGFRVRRWLRDRGVLEKATFTGMLLGGDKVAALHGAEVFVLPSYYENFGVAVLEAMACRLPVVVSDRVAIAREVGAAGAGLVVRCDWRELAQALARLLSQPDQSRAMGARGADLVRQRFSWAVVGGAMADAYERSISRQIGCPGVLLASGGG